MTYVTAKYNNVIVKSKNDTVPLKPKFFGRSKIGAESFKNVATNLSSENFLILNFREIYQVRISRKLNFFPTILNVAASAFIKFNLIKFIDN